jgi:hypothetical protein
MRTGVLDKLVTGLIPFDVSFFKFGKDYIFGATQCIDKCLMCPCIE